MNDYRDRLEASGRLKVFEKCRVAADNEGMATVLRVAKFSEPEIEAILWAKGDITPPGESDEKESIWRNFTGRLSIALISGLLLGGVFVYYSAGLNREPRSGETKMDMAMKDYRSPKDIYYRPFIWGFLVGAIGGFVLGSVVYDPTSKGA